MASSTLTPYKDNTNQVTFTLVSTGADGATYSVSGRSISQPHMVKIKRKFTNPGAPGNDRIEISVIRTEANATTGKLATLVAGAYVSIPKDDSVLTNAVQKEALAIVASLINESAAMQATTTAITAIVEGRDL